MEEISHGAPSRTIMAAPRAYQLQEEGDLDGYQVTLRMTEGD